MIKATYVDHMGSDLSVVNAARVSFAKHKEVLDNVTVGDYTVRLVLDNKDTKLINYLAKHKHTSPFGHAFASFHVKAPVFVARQLVKHKFLRWNEISRRYVDDEPEFYVPDVWRGRSADKKQGSSDQEVEHVSYLDPVGGPSRTKAWRHYDHHIIEIEQAYTDMIKSGVCPEQARMVLPQSMMTEWYWSGSLDAFADMCNLRLKTDTQYETQLVAQQIDQIMLGLFPVSWEALVYGDD
jgi:thymidylate synthase (FAD)